MDVHGPSELTQIPSDSAVPIGLVKVDVILHRLVSCDYHVQFLLLVLSLDNRDTSSRGLMIHRASNFNNVS
jgi:hypothetical protein